MKSNDGSEVLRPVARVRGGVKVPHRKNTASIKPVRISIPERVVLPMRQHIGAPCEPLVKIGDKVAVGQPIGDTSAFVAAPIHASVSGTVISLSPVKLSNGTVGSAVTIQSDGLMTEWEGIAPPEVNDTKSFLSAVRASGLVGLGGAGFPTHVKLGLKPGAKVDTLIVNAAECEPYITVDYRQCIDEPADVLGGIYALMEYIGFTQVIIAVEDNKPDAISILNDIAQSDLGDGNKIRLMTLKSQYPQGAEKMMVLSTTGRKVPPGGLPSDVGCVVMNVGSVAFISRYLRTGKALVSRTMTVDGSAIAKPQNVRVPIGISIREVIDFCGGFKCEPYKLITGGPMMGVAIYSEDFPVLKQNNAILALGKGQVKEKKTVDCIRCGRCSRVCPMYLAPTLIKDGVKTGDKEQLLKLGTASCMECGSCAYACPSGIPLVQYMRRAKELIK
ncbi:MAG: electron transport complex subunit RsxC [Clostridia bacterium]|nr:electron transport complex subunit RsxC [Clostridia bacterium]